MQNHYIIHKTIHHSPLLTLIFLHILSTRAANDRPYTLFSFPSRFVGATIGRPLSHTLPTRAANDRPYTLSSFPSHFVGATIGRPLSHTLPTRAANDRHYTLSSFPSHFAWATIGRPLSHTLPVRWHITDLPSFRMGDHWSPTYHTQKSHNSLTFPCKPSQNIV